MSISSSARFNADALQAALPVGAFFSSDGGAVDSATAKTITFFGTDDVTGQAAVTTAAGQFVDRAANRATITTRANAALTANATYLAIASPTTAQAVAQTATLTKECNGIIRLLLQVLDSTAGT